MDEIIGSKRNRRRRGGQTPGRSPSINQQPWEIPHRSFRPMELLSEDQVELIHENSLKILEELGVELMSEAACKIYEDAGAVVDWSTLRVCVPRDVLQDLISKAPSRFTITSRNSDRALPIGGNSMVATMVAGPPSVHDCVRGRRSGNLADYEDFVRLAQSFNAVHMIGNQVTAPMELPAETRHLDCYFSNLTLSDRSFHVTAIGRERALSGIEMMAISRGDRLEDMIERPGVSTIISVNSPRRFDGEMAEGLMTMAEFGQPVSVTPFTLMGAMTPVTLPAALSQQNAEALFGIGLAQAVRPGAPCLYGSFLSNVDMRSGAPGFGTPEHAKACIASGQLARRYALPYRVSPGNASNAADEQSVWETMMSLWGCVMGGANLLYHGAGWLEGGLQASFEKFVMDVEMLQNMYATMKPLDFSKDDLGFEAIAGVPTGGHFFGEPHTMARYSTAFYQPMLSDWRNYETWEEAGAETAKNRATTLWQNALSSFEAPALDGDKRAALEDYVARKKAAAVS